jgi:hypothetical protein
MSQVTEKAVKHGHVAEGEKRNEAEANKLEGE